jgi:hypothetical protein
MNFMGWQDREARRNRRLIFTDSPEDEVASPPDEEVTSVQSGESQPDMLFSLPEKPDATP